MGGAARAGDDRPQPASGRGLGEGEHLVGHPMCRQHLRLVRHAELGRGPPPPCSWSTSRWSTPSRRRRGVGSSPPVWRVGRLRPRRRPVRRRRPRRGPGVVRRSRRCARRSRRRPSGRGTATPPGSAAPPAPPSRVGGCWFVPVGWCSRVSSPSAMPIGTRSVLCTMPLVCARIHQFSMSRVMPRSCPTTMPLVTISTGHPRSASSSATDVAWWKPISSMTTTVWPGCGPPSAAEPSMTSRTSATLRRRRRAPTRGGAGSAPIATITWSGVRSCTSPATRRRRTRSSRRGGRTR